MLKLLGGLAPARRRAFALGLFNMAPSVGATIGPVVVPLLAWSLGWRWAAVITGGLGLIWLGWWLKASRPEPAFAPLHPAHGQPLRRPAVWLLVAAKALTDQLWWFFLYWLPALFHARGIGAQLSIAGCWATVAAMLLLATIPLLPLSLAACGLAIFGHQILSVLIFSAISDDCVRARTGTIAGIAAFAGNFLAVGSVALVSKSLVARLGYTPRSSAWRSPISPEAPA